MSADPCPILSLFIQTLDLNLLGLRVQLLQPLNVTITAVCFLCCSLVSFALIGFRIPMPFLCARAGPNRRRAWPAAVLAEQPEHVLHSALLSARRSAHRGQQRGFWRAPHHRVPLGADLHFGLWFHRF